MKRAEKNGINVIFSAGGGSIVYISGSVAHEKDLNVSLESV